MSLTQVVLFPLCLHRGLKGFNKTPGTAFSKCTIVMDAKSFEDEFMKGGGNC